MPWQQGQAMSRSESMRAVARNKLDRAPRPCDECLVVHAGSYRAT